MRYEKAYSLRQQNELYKAYLDAYKSAIDNGYTEADATRFGAFRQSKLLKQIEPLQQWLYDRRIFNHGK